VRSIALGLYDFVLAAGVEKMTASPTAEVTAALATAGDDEGEPVPATVVNNPH